MTPTTNRPDVTGLVAAIARNKEPGNLGALLEGHYWTTLAEYAHPCVLQRGHLLIAQGDHDRKLYFVESGDLKVDMRTDKGLVRLAIVGPGNVVGEGNFFLRQSRSASVSVYSDCKVWEIAPSDFDSLSHAKPNIALALALALGGVLAARLLDISRRISVT